MGFFPLSPLQISLTLSLLSPSSVQSFTTTNHVVKRQELGGGLSSSSSWKIFSSRTEWDNDDFMSSLSMPQTSTQTSTEDDYSSISPAAAPYGYDDTGGYSSQQPQQQPQPPQPQMQIQKQEVGALPLGWSAHFDPNTRQLYYYNVNDGTTTWDKPIPPPPPPPVSAQYASNVNQHKQQLPTVGTIALSPLPAAAGGLAAALPPEEEQNTDEELPTENLEGAALTADMKAKMKASHTQEEEASQGGQKFREMIEKAKKMQQQQSRSGIGGNAAQPVSTQLKLPPNAASLPIEEQARLFREMFWRAQNKEMYSRPQPTYQSPGIGIDGRKIGRNRDADIISNTADAYLAQLKRDSTTRNLARYAGNDVKANAVFHDARIEEIKAPELNPYLKERRERERNMLETVPDEMLLFQEYGKAPTEEERTRSGISYRDKIAQIKAARQKGT